MYEKHYNGKQKQLAKFAKAMGHPARIVILEYLAGQESCSFGDLHEILPLSKATVSQHMKELKESGLVDWEADPPKVKYFLNRENRELAKKLMSEFF